MEFRKFYLQNAAGERIDLNGADAIWATDPVGLGVELSPVTGDLSHGFFKPLQASTRVQGKPGLTLTFSDRNRNYEQYRELMRWIAAAGDGLLLIYRPSGSDEFLRRVLLRTVRKKEKNKVGWLETPLELVTLTPWFLPYDVRFELAAESENTARYSYRLGSARYAASHAPSFAATLQPSGDEPASIQLSFTGTIQNPLITLTGLVSGTVYGRCAVSDTIASGETLEYSSRPSDCFCRVIRSGSPVALDDKINPSADPWLRLPLTEPCSLQMSGLTVSGSASVAVNYYYSTV